MKSLVIGNWPRQKQLARRRPPSELTWFGYVLFCWAHRCSLLCIGCILSRLWMLCRSTLPLSAELIGNGFGLGNPPCCTVLTLVPFVYGLQVLPSATHAIYRVYFLITGYLRWNYLYLLNCTTFIAKRTTRKKHFATFHENEEDLDNTYFSMILLVALSWKTDPFLLLCNRKDLFYIRVSKLLDSSSPKSMWFLWNIFSKGSHMLQCLCGKSLKKNKNPSGKPFCAVLFCFVTALFCIVYCGSDRSAIIFCAASKRRSAGNNLSYSRLPPVPAQQHAKAEADAIRL